MLWLYIYFPSLQLDNLLAENNISSTNAIVVIDAKKNEVMQLNKTAIATGIHLKMGLASAAMLCSELQVVPYQAPIENDLLYLIAEHLYQVSSDIALNQPCGLFIKVSNMLSLYHDIDDYWTEIEKILKVFKVNYYAATAYTPFAAQVLAQAKQLLICQDKDKLQHALYSLPIETLLLSEKSKKCFKKMGIKTNKQCFTLPFHEVAQRFNKEEVQYLAQVQGKITTSFQYFQFKLYFSYSLDLLYEIKNTAVLEHPLKKVLTLLESFLYQKNLVTQELVFIFSSRDAAPLTLKVTSAHGEYNKTTWLNLTMLKLSRIKLLVPITIISIKVTHFSSNKGEMCDLFIGQSQGIQSSHLLSILLNKLDKKNVLKLARYDEHRPEKASQYHLINEKKLNTNDITKFKRVPLRPSLLLNKPELLAMSIDVLHGPERIQTAWWDKEQATRDYFIARNHEGQLCWVYRQPDQQWFLHGFFA